MLAKHAKARAQALLAGQALFAMPAAQRGVDHHAPPDPHTINFLAHGGNHASHIRAPNMRHRQLQARNAGAHPQIEVVERHGLDFDQCLVRANHRLGHTGVAQLLGAAMLIENKRTHRKLLCGQNREPAKLNPYIFAPFALFAVYSFSGR